MSKSSPSADVALRDALAALRQTPKTRAPTWAITYRAADYPPWGYTADVIGLAVDTGAGQLRALLIERRQEPFAGSAAFPGGFVEQRTDASARAAAERELREEVGRGSVGYLETLDTYDAAGRDPRQFAGEIEPGSGRWIERGARVVSKAFLALLQEGDIALEPQPDQDAIRPHWVNVYSLLPWENVRDVDGQRLTRALTARLREWATLGDAKESAVRAHRIRRAWGRSLATWNDELANERHALLLEAGLLEEAWRDRWGQVRADTPRGLLAPGHVLAFDHRRMLADAVARVRSKMRYVPGVLAALAGREVTLPTLQRVVEAVAGRSLHTSNFRRVVTESHGLLRPSGRRRATGVGRGPRPVIYTFPADVAYARLETAIRPPWLPLGGS